MENYAQLPDGRLLLADGLNPMKTWDGLAAAPADAGNAAPVAAVTLAGQAGSRGPILGTYEAYVRFVDALGQVSNFGPVSASVDVSSGAALPIDTMTLADPAVITFSGAHGLHDNDLIVITGATTPAELNNVWLVTKIDGTSVSLQGLDSTGLEALTGAPVADTGVAQITYTNVPVPTSPRITHVEILRNTSGELTTFYVDATVNAGTTVTTSTRTDGDLSSQEAVPIVDPDGSLNAFAHGVPPNWKTVLAHHLGRVFATVDAVVTTGNVIVTILSTHVFGIGTDWTDALVGRLLYVNGASQAYEIASIDVARQILTLTVTYADASAPYASYAIRPGAGDRRLVYYTLAGQPESWPATNALELQEDGDEITGLMVKGSFLYILESRHIYRFTFQADPALDGFVFLSVERGCINQRCWVQAEGTAYMLDYNGIHAYDGGESKPISMAVQRLFQPGETSLSINWDAAEQFHASIDPHAEIIRWFVCLRGSYLPHHALCYHYRLQRWWIEEYPYPVGASVTGFFRGYRQPFGGSSAARVFLIDKGQLDGIDRGACTTAGGVSSATPYSLTDTAASFTAAAVGIPVTIAKGKGRGQRRLVTAVANGTTLSVNDPWRVQPDASSRYKLGGIPWVWKTGTYHLAPGETESNRRLGVFFDPAKTESWLALRMFFNADIAPAIMAHTTPGRDDEGFEVTKGEADLVLDVTRSDGYAQQRVDGHRESNIAGQRDVRFEFDGTAEETGMGFSEVQLEGVLPHRGGAVDDGG